METPHHTSKMTREQAIAQAHDTSAICLLVKPKDKRSFYCFLYSRNSVNTVKQMMKNLGGTTEEIADGTH
jgi:hypothetical protein